MIRQSNRVVWCVTSSALYSMRLSEGGIVHCGFVAICVPSNLARHTFTSHPAAHSARQKSAAFYSVDHTLVVSSGHVSTACYAAGGAEIPGCDTAYAKLQLEASHLPPLAGPNNDDEEGNRRKGSTNVLLICVQATGHCGCRTPDGGGEASWNATTELRHLVLRTSRQCGTTAIRGSTYCMARGR